MKASLNQFVPVVIEMPCLLNEGSEVAELFHRIIRLKMKGYGAQYGAGVLPIDTTDFICTHLLVCVRSGEGLRPVMGYKTMEMSVCAHFQVEFPGLSLVKRSATPRHVAAVEKIMADSRSKGIKLAYCSSWTVDPKFAEDKDSKRMLRELFEAVYILYPREKEILGSLAGGTLRFKTEKMLSRMGYNALSENGEVLPPIRVAHLLGEPVQVMHTEKFSSEALAHAQKYQHWWRRKIVFDAEEVLGIIRRAS